jgi:hypothetical protein
MTGSAFVLEIPGEFPAFENLTCGVMVGWTRIARES